MIAVLSDVGLVEPVLRCVTDVSPFSKHRVGTFPLGRTARFDPAATPFISRTAPSWSIPGRVFADTGLDVSYPSGNSTE